MYVILSTSIETSPEEQPRRNYNTDEYRHRALAKEIFKSQLIQMAINFAKTGSTCDIEKLVDRINSEFIWKPEPSYSIQADDDAKDLITNFMDEIIDQLIIQGEASVVYNNEVDRGYSEKDAVELIDELSDYEEIDSGLWEGEDLRGILSAKAAFTYGNAVYDKWHALIDEINQIDMDEINDMATRATLKQIPKPISNADRQWIKAGDLNEWLEEFYEDIFLEAKKNILKPEIEEILR